MKTYKIVRMYKNERPPQLEDNALGFLFQNRNTVIKTGLTLKQAQEHCSDPETSSRTCTSALSVEHTEKHGDWFDGYEEE